MKSVAYPYPVLQTSTLPEPEWFLREGENLLPLSEGISAWDAELSLALKGSLAGWPDFAELFETSGLSEAFRHASLSVLAETGHSPITGHRFTAFRKSLRQIDREEGISFELDSTRLIEKVTLHVLITVSACTVQGFELRDSSILFRHIFSLPLEGSLANFPLRPVSFAEQRLGSGLWLVDLDPISDLNQSLLGSLLVYLNTDQGNVVDRLNTADDPALDCLFQADIVATVLQVILGDESLDPDLGQSYAEGSIGAVAIAWLQALCDDDRSHLTLDMLREEIARNPGKFRSRCQGFTIGGKQ